MSEKRYPVEEMSHDYDPTLEAIREATSQLIHVRDRVSMLTQRKAELETRLASSNNTTTVNVKSQLLETDDLLVGFQETAEALKIQIQQLKQEYRGEQHLLSEFEQYKPGHND